MFSTSVIEINETAFKGNIAFIKELIGEDVKFSSVVKGNAYGHGIRSFVPLAQKCGINHFSVFSAEEAYQALQVTDGNSEIMIMGMIDLSDLEWAINNDISFFIFNKS